MINNIYVLDNVVSKQYQEHIKHYVLNDTWFLSSDVTFSQGLPAGTKRQARPAMSQLLLKDGVAKTSTQTFLHPLILEACNRIKFTPKNVLDGKALLQFPLADKIVAGEEDFLHVDSSNDHLVCLYYVVDADGDTLIYDKMLKQGEIADHSVEVSSRDCKLLKRVTPKQGRMVLFNGRHFHTAEQPRLGIRCILNYNVI